MALRARAYTRTAQPTAVAAEAYFREVFFGPLRDPDLPSWVCTGSDGRVAGFIGVLARRIRVRNDERRMAVPTQLMAEPGANALIGVRLLRQVFQGPQDLTFADVANDAARQIWERLGGATAYLLSLYWTRAIRPLHEAVAGLGTGPAARALRLALRPVTLPLDGALASRAAARWRRNRTLAAEPLTAEHVLQALDGAVGRRPLAPAYDAATLRWLWTRLGDRGVVDAVHVRDAGRGDTAGWFICLSRGRICEVAQLAAAPGRFGDVLDCAVGHAAARGAGALAGRLEPAQVHELATRDCRLHREGPWTLVHSRDPEIAAAVHRGDAFLSRLEGEWWANF